MKKSYKKPQVMFEEITLSSAIAACNYVLEEGVGCNEIATGGDGILQGPYTNVIAGVSFIANVGVEGSMCQNEFECYHNPAVDIVNSLQGLS